MEIEVVDWKLVGACNLRCPHCYGPPKSEQALEQEKLLTIVSKFKELGVEWVVLTGGEPLLVPNIETVIKSIKEIDAKVALSTNTSYFRSFQNVIERYISSLNIPLDGSTPQIHARSRKDEESYYTFFDVLDHYKRNPLAKPELLRVGTVYSKANNGDFVSIARKLEPYESIIDTWKIYEIIDYDIQQKLRKPLMHESSDFEQEMEELIASTSLAPKIMLAPANLRDKAYFMIDPNGFVVIPTDFNGVTREVPIGYILNEPLEKIVKLWNAFVIDKNYSDNHAHYEKLYRPA